MSEDVKPRAWTLVFDHDEEIGHIRTLEKYTKRNRHDEHVDVIELEPTMRLMNELAQILEFCSFDNASRRESQFEAKSILEKYKKFKDALK